jgi:Domain of unknown function (DUF2760)
MGRVTTAFRAFFRSLFDASTATRVDEALRATGFPAGRDQVPQPSPSQPSPSQPSPSQPSPSQPNPSQPRPVAAEPVQIREQKPVQNGAITLLASLQRDARLVDFLQEDLSNYSNEQVGAAVRDIHRDSAQVLERFFAIRSVLKQAEGDKITVPAGFDAGRYRLTGKLNGTAPFQGTLQHHGWEVTKCELPAFTGSESAGKTIAPVEVEIL